MEKSMEMLIEYVLERCTGLETENRRLTQQIRKAEELKDQFYDGYSKQADQLATLARLIKPEVTWKENGAADYLSIYNTTIAQEICKILRISKEDMR